MSFFHAGAQPALNSSGAPISGAIWKFYLAGTSTPTPVYADEMLSSSLGNTVTANGSGRFVPIFLDDSVIYKAVITDAGGTPLTNGTFEGVNRARDVFDIRDFGAISDGSTDATAAIRQALDAVENQGWGIVRIEGNYALSSAALSAAGISVPSNCDIDMRGANITVTGTTVCNKFLVTNASNVRIHGGRITITASQPARRRS